MSKLIRHFKKGDTCFITAVTENRIPLLLKHGQVLQKVLNSFSIEPDISIIAYVILPDHFHTIIESSTGGFSTFVKRIKLKFSYQYRQAEAVYRKKVWQSSFWDHIIRNQIDMNRHLDYIHFNPVKHHLVNKPYDWELSSIHDYRQQGFYQDDWGSKEPEGMGGDYGE